MAVSTARGRLLWEHGDGHPAPAGGAVELLERLPADARVAVAGQEDDVGDDARGLALVGPQEQARVKRFHLRHLPDDVLPGPDLRMLGCTNWARKMGKWFPCRPTHILAICRMQPHSSITAFASTTLCGADAFRLVAQRLQVLVDVRKVRVRGGDLGIQRRKAAGAVPGSAPGRLSGTG